MQFKRSIGPIGLMFTAVSGIMGSAWLFGPYYAVQYAGPASLLAWLLGGLAMLVIAMTFAELVCMLPVSGGNARFIYFSHGVLASFIFSWIMWLGYSAVAPVETMGIMQYLSSVFPWLVVQKSGVTVLTMSGYIMSASVLLLLCIFNLFSIKWLTRYNALIVWVKLLVPILVAVVVICTVFHPANFHHMHGFMPSGFNGVAAAISLGGIIFSFAGYAPAIVLAGEAKNPQRTVPLVLLGALVVCLLIYMLLEVGFIGAQAPQNLAHGWRHLSFAHDASPFLGLIEQIHQGWLGILVFITAILAPFGTALIFVTTSSRVAYAMSQNGYFPNIFQLLSKRGVPTFAVLINFVIGMILFFPSPGWQGMVGFLVSAFVLCYAVGPISLLALRRQLPDYHRPFKLPLYPVWAYCAFFFANLIVFWTGWHIYSEMLIAMGVGVVLLCVVMMVNRKRIPLQWPSAVWAAAYLAGLGFISYCSSYGNGIDLIPGAYDVALLAVFSLVILLWSMKARLPDQITRQWVDDQVDI